MQLLQTGRSLISPVHSFDDIAKQFKSISGQWPVVFDNFLVCLCESEPSLWNTVLRTSLMRVPPNDHTRVESLSSFLEHASSHLSVEELAASLPSSVDLFSFLPHLKTSLSRQSAKAVLSQMLESVKSDAGNPQQISFSSSVLYGPWKAV